MKEFSAPTFKQMLQKTAFVVEATSFEQHCLWMQHSIDSNNRIYSPVNWEQINPGWIVNVGELNNMPINILISWAKNDGCLVMFWYSCSRITDSVKAEEWINKSFNGKWDNKTRDAITNAMNFHHCINAINEINKRNQNEEKY